MISKELVLTGIAAVPLVGSTWSTKTLKVSEPTVATPTLTLAPVMTGKDDAHVVVMDEVGVAVGGDEGVLRGFGQVGDELRRGCRWSRCSRWRR